MRIAVFSIFLFFSACATHAPMSEMVMFTPKKVKSYSSLKDSVQVHYSKLSFAVSGQGTKVISGSVADYASQNGEFGEEFLKGTVGAAGLNVILLANKVDYIGFSASLFPALGIDGTIKLSEKNFFTYGYTLLGGHQIILQRKIVYNNEIGLAAGVFFDRIDQHLYSNVGSYYIFPNIIINNNVLGVRLLRMSHDDFKNRHFINFNTKLGYVFETGSPYLSAGLSVGVF